MNTLLLWLVGLYIVALHTSIAAMEIFSTATVLVTGYGLLVEGWQPRWRAWDRNLIWLLTAFVFWVGLTTFHAPPLKPFWFQFGFMRWTLVLGALMLVLEQIWNPESERRLVQVWASAICVTGVYAVFQTLTGIDFIRTTAVQPQGGGIYKAAGFFNISLTFAYCLGISVFAVFQAALARNRRLGIATIILGAAGLVASMSRGAWLAGLICAFAYLFIRQRRLIVPALAVLALTIAVLVWQGGGFATKISMMAHLQMDHSSATRIDVWRGYWQMFLENPVFGIGIFSGDKYLPEYYVKLGIHQEFVSHAHNNLLQFLAGTGLPGFLLYVAVCGWFMAAAWQIRHLTAWGWPLLLAQVFVQLGGLTECNFIDGEVNHNLMLVWALTWMLHRKKLSDL